MYPVPPVRNIATLLRSSQSSQRRHSRLLSLPPPCAAASAAAAVRELPADALQLADTSSAATPECVCRSNTPTNPTQPCHNRKSLFLQGSMLAITSPRYPRQNRARFAE